MQVKPRFKSYRMLKKIPVIKDNKANQMCLTLVSAIEGNDVPYKFWTVVSDRQTKWQNGALSYDYAAYWTGMYLGRDLIDKEIEGLHIVEYMDGVHALDCPQYIGIKDAEPNPGLRTRFKVNGKVEYEIDIL